MEKQHYGSLYDKTTPARALHSTSHLSDLFECLWIHVCEDIALRKREDLEGNSTVMVLQRGDVVVAHCQLCAGIDLVPDRRHG